MQWAISPDCITMWVGWWEFHQKKKRGVFGGPNHSTERWVLSALLRYSLDGEYSFYENAGNYSLAMIGIWHLQTFFIVHIFTLVGGGQLGHGEY